MAKETVEVLIEGGKATAAPPLGPALGPMGVNIGQVVQDINKKTASFAKMQVPVKVTIDMTDKSYEITVGTPPASALIKKEAGVDKGAGNPLTDKVADLKIEQIIKIAQMKADDTLGKDTKGKVKEIVGTCQSMGILVEGVPAHEAIDQINAGKFDAQILGGKTELSEAEKKELEEEKKKLAEELKEKHDMYAKQADQILKDLAGKEPREIVKAMKDAGIPDPVIHEKAPAEDKKK
ncbi:50S ribosomal protein L11 [Candidatus Woesearchaeota archaeon]|nr:50S ribosomal protein L11 [Candidatus Woesearchaeota archaeon]